MSMSQEEIESLMNGLDISENENSKEEEISEESEESQSMSEEDIEALIAQTNLDSSSNSDETSDVKEDIDNDSIDDLLKELEDTNETVSDTVDNDSIDDLIGSLENNDEKELSSDEQNISAEEESNTGSLADEDIDALINDINSEQSSDTEEVDTSDIDELLEGLKNNDDSMDDYLKDLDDLDINQNAESLEDIDTKSYEDIQEEDPSDRFKNVVSVDKINIPNQLGQVANDSEEKATKIFDALSYILDDNNSLRKTFKGLDSFIQSQQKMLETLNAKFPNVKEFSDNLELVNSLSEMPKEIQTRLNERDQELFEAMELMQFHDINRQKIERVMKVVVNLSKQLSEIFEDNSGNSDAIPISKHLPGDNSQDLVGSDDLESLIKEFGK